MKWEKENKKRSRNARTFGLKEPPPWTSPNILQHRGPIRDQQRRTSAGMRHGRPMNLRWRQCFTGSMDSEELPTFGIRRVLTNKNDLITSSSTCILPYASVMLSFRTVVSQMGPLYPIVVISDINGVKENRPDAAKSRCPLQEVS